MELTSSLPSFTISQAHPLPKRAKPAALNFVLNSSGKQSERSASLFLLTQSSLSAKALSEIAQSPIPEYEFAADPHSRDAQLKAYEISSRVNAMEALDIKYGQDKKLRREIEAVLRRQNDKTIHFLAQVSLNNPGHVPLVIDQIVAGIR